MYDEENFFEVKGKGSLRQKGYMRKGNDLKKPALRNDT